MARHNDLGKEGERYAVEHLRKNGYEILETNWSFGKAEVDIIARRGNILAAIEVKTRSDIVFGLPQDFVNAKKIRLLVNAVNHYVEKLDDELETRFDIIALVQYDRQWQLEHIEDAFYHF